MDGGWRVEGGGWMEGGGWRVEGGGWRVEGGGWRGCANKAVNFLDLCAAALKGLQEVFLSTAASAIWYEACSLWFVVQLAVASCCVAQRHSAICIGNDVVLFRCCGYAVLLWHKVRIAVCAVLPVRDDACVASAAATFAATRCQRRQSRRRDIVAAKKLSKPFASTAGELRAAPTGAR